MVDVPATKEPQYSELFEAKQKHGITRLGLMVIQVWNQDPKRTLFTLARYKVVARMLAGRKHVLEVGCADACGTRIVQQAVGKVTAIEQHFHSVFVFSMNDEVVHTGFYPMSHYLLGLACHRRGT
jgi:hypothetical protein